MEGTSVNEVKLSLKIMVDTKARKVVFAEAGTEFVDFLFHMLSLPLATVVKLLSNEEMTGSLPALYKGVESLSAEFFKKNVNRETVLMPKLPVYQPLLSPNHAPSSITFYKCPNHRDWSFREGLTCHHPHSVTVGICGKPMHKVILSSDNQTSKNDIPGFVKKAVPYIVMDDLEVKPMSMNLIKSLVCDTDRLVEKDVEFGTKEALTLLRNSFITNSVLTTVFPEIKKEILF